MLVVVVVVAVAVVVVVVIVVPFGQGSSLLWTHMLRPFLAGPWH